MSASPMALILAISMFVALTSTECSGSNASKYFSDPEVFPLAVAIEKSDLDAMDRLVRAGVSPDSSGRDNMTLLDWAMATDQKAAFRKLLMLGADPNRPWKSGGTTIVHRAAMHPDDAWLKMTLEFRGDPNVPDSLGETAIFWAIGIREAGHVDLLLKSGTDLEQRNKLGETPLLFVANQMNYPIVLQLLEAGASYTASDDMGLDFVSRVRTRRPRSRELEAARLLVIEFLAQRGVQVN